MCGRANVAPPVDAHFCTVGDINPDAGAVRINKVWKHGQRRPSGATRPRTPEADSSRKVSPGLLVQTGSAK
jgi:hypothetical protein